MAPPPAPTGLVPPPRPSRRRPRIRNWYLQPLLLTLLILLLASRSETHTGPFTVPPSDSSSRPSALILTAHPDDEVMFFSPTILNLVSSGWDVYGLCLSVGRSFTAGSGETRREELFSSYAQLGVPRNQVEILDHDELQDGPTHVWADSLVGQIVSNHLETHPVQLLITFDNRGISLHPNHLVLSRTHLHLRLQSSPPHVLLLSTPSIWVKYTSLFYSIILRLRNLLIPLIHFFDTLGDSYGSKSPEVPVIRVVNTPYQWFIAVRAMRKHQSQMVWFRWLYLGFSGLMWGNELVVDV